MVSAQAAAPGWATRLPDCVITAPDALPAGLEGFESVWIDAADARPIITARELARHDESLQAVVVASAEDIAIHERTLLFTPGLGEVWLLTPDKVSHDAAERAAELTGKRRRYAQSRGAMSRAIQHTVERRPRRTVVSDAYLARLLQILPDPVLSIDEAGLVVSWSDAGTRLLGISDVEAIGRPVIDVLQPRDPESLASALERALDETQRLELRVRGKTGTLIMEAVVTAVQAGGAEVRAVVLRDVTAEREAKERLEREAELRSRFYAAMSHEIRTPINTILGYNELLRTGAGDPRKRDEYLDRSQKAANLLLELVNDVLDLSKLESGMLEVQPEKVRASALMSDFSAALDPLARDRETPLEVECLDGDFTLFSDPRRIHQILLNLGTNALKFGDRKPVTVRAWAEGEDAVFEVQDRGRGIAAADQPHVFEDFYQVSGTEGGTGLGLSISLKLARILGGDLTVDSELDQGSTFRVRVRKRLPAPPRQTPG